MDFETKVSALKEMERLVYRICVFLLGDTRQASQAAEQTLLQLYSDTVYWQADEAARLLILRKSASFNCLQSRKLAV